MKRAKSRRWIPAPQQQDDRPVRTQENVLAGISEAPVEPPSLMPEHTDAKRRWAQSIHDAAVGENLHHLFALWSRGAALGDRFGYGAGGSLERLPELAMAA